MKQQLISVIVPVYNVEKFIHECVDSIIAQSYTCWEAILVDDGSTDLSAEICDNYAQNDSRITVIHKPNGGLSSARNAGFAAANGEYIYFLDGDDYIIPNALELLLKAAQEQDSAVVFFNALSFDEQTGEQCKRQAYLRKCDYGTLSGKQALDKMTELKDFHSSVPLLFIKTELLRSSRLTFVNGILYEDMVFTFELFCLAERVSHLNMPLYMRRYREGSIVKSKKTQRNFLSSVTVYNEILKFLTENKINQNFANSYISNRALNAIDNFDALDFSQKNECRKQYGDLKQSIKQHGAFNNKFLYARCYGKAVWAAYKLINKFTGI